MKKNALPIILCLLSGSICSMVPDQNECIFSLKNRTLDTVEIVLANANNTHRHIPPIESKKIYQAKAHELTTTEELVVYVFRRNKVPKGKYEAGWSIPAGKPSIHLILKANIYDNLSLTPDILIKPNITPLDIRKIFPLTNI